MAKQAHRVPSTHASNYLPREHYFRIHMVSLGNVTRRRGKRQKKPPREDKPNPVETSHLSGRGGEGREERTKERGCDPLGRIRVSSLLTRPRKGLVDSRRDGVASSPEYSKRVSPSEVSATGTRRPTSLSESSRAPPYRPEAEDEALQRREEEMMLRALPRALSRSSDGRTRRAFNGGGHEGEERHERIGVAARADLTGRRCAR